MTATAPAFAQPAEGSSEPVVLEPNEDVQPPEASKPVVPASVAGARKAAASEGSSQPWLDEAIADKRQRDEARQRQEDQYRRNIYAVQLAFGREIVKTREEVRGYSGRAEFAMLLPSEDGASPLWVIAMGLSGWGSGEEDRNGESAWGFGVPLSFGYGYRTPWLIGYGGLSFGMGMDKGAEPAAGAYGFFGNLGFDIMGFRLLADTRAEFRIMKAGESRWHLTYGALASVDL
jgi:hypothetical protein